MIQKLNKIQPLWYAIAVALLPCVIFLEDKILWLGLLTIWIIRILLLRQFKVTFLAIIVGLVFFIHFKNIQTRINAFNALDNKIIRVVKAKATPDQIDVKGDHFTIHSFDNNVVHSRITISGYLKKQEQQELLAKINKTSVINVKGIFEKLAKPTNFNQPDFALNSYGKGEYVKFNKATFVSAEDYANKSIYTAIHQLRFNLMNRCRRLIEPVKGYCLTLLFGSQTETFNENNEALKNVGIIHLFSISGLHVFAFTMLLERLGAVIGLTRGKIKFLVVGLLPVYYVVGGGSTSLFRAAVSAAILAVAKGTKRLDGLNIWSLVLMLNLFINPFVLLSLGGFLSYLLSFILIMQARVENVGSLMSSWNLFLISVPILLFKTYQINLLTTLFNMVFIPVFSTVVFPLVAITYFVPSLDKLSNVIIQIFNKMIQVSNELPGLINFGKPNELITVLIFVASLVYIGKKSWRKSTGLFLMSIYFLTFLIIHIPMNGEVSFFDVGQGDSILIREPLNKSITLIDTGGHVGFEKPSWARTRENHFIAANSSIPYLKSKGITRLNNLCLTHQDADHIGEVSEILKNFHVDRLIISNGMQNTLGFKRKILPFLKNETKLTTILAGVHLKRLPFEILGPNHSGSGKNEDSITLYGKFGGKTFLFSGDLGQEGECELLQRNPNLRVDVFKLGHHGSKTSNGKNFLAEIQPKLAIISAGRDNHYNHPNPETIHRLKELDIPSVSTQTRGMISYRYGVRNVGKWYTKIVQ